MRVIRGSWVGPFKRFAVAGPLVLALGASAAPVAAATCDHEDFQTRIAGTSGCLVMRRYGSTDAAVMVVWLHGNITAGGPANAHFRLAERAAVDHAGHKLLTVALVRPGYPDGSGATSSGRDGGRADNWRRATVDDIGTAIERLRQHFLPERVVIAGHSGGAAIAAVLMGLKPDLAQAALLVACPCDLTAWRQGKPGPTWTSEDPLRWVDQVNPSARIVALTGSHVDTTPAALARTFIERLRARGMDASFDRVPDAGHVDVLGSASITAATAALARR